MQYLSFQNLDIPLVYVTGLSYTKTARVSTNAQGFSRFLGYETAEISVRISLNFALAMAADRGFVQDLLTLIYAEPDKSSTPTFVTIGNHILYPSLLFRVSSINKTIAADHTGTIENIEVDITLSGVECTKEKTGNKAYVFEDEEAIQLPKITLSCLGKDYILGEESSISTFTLTPREVNLEICFGTDNTKVSDISWLVDVVNNNSTVTIDGYGKFYTVSASLVNNVLTLVGSVWSKEMAQPITKTVRQATLEEAIKAILPSSDTALHFNGLTAQIDNLIVQDTPLNILNALQQSAGFITSFRADGITFVKVPDVIKPDVDFTMYLEADLVTEPITGCIWKDGLHEVVAGSVDKSTSFNVKSIFSSSDMRHAQNCLDYARYMQNKIEFNAPLDTKIRHHSAFNIVIGESIIPCMVEDYNIDFLSNSMQIQAQYVNRG